MGIRIRTAMATDAERFVALYHEFTRYLRTLGDKPGDKLTSDIYRRDGFGENPSFSGLVAEFENEVVGYMLYHFGYDAELAARVMYVIDLFVAEEHRMRGAGASLMNRAKSICSETDASEIIWSVYKPNHGARVFYERIGAELIEDLDYMRLKVDGQDGQ